jgi:hypothetical protein
VYLPIPPQPDCASAWLEATRLVNAESGHEASNVIIDVADPTAGSGHSHPVVARVNEVLLGCDKSVEAVSNTIFPQSLYYRYKHPQFIKVFHKRVLPKVRTNARWSGYYFERMTNMPVPGEGEPIDQLSRMVERMKDKKNTALNKYELSIFDPSRDVTGSPYGGQCLSLLSFHLAPSPDTSAKTLLLTAQYRNHYYVEKLLGNLIGLGRLMAFVAAETSAHVGSLTVISTHAFVDAPTGSRKDVSRLIEACASFAPMPADAAAV